METTHFGGSTQYSLDCINIGLTICLGWSLECKGCVLSWSSTPDQRMIFLIHHDQTTENRLHKDHKFSLYYITGDQNAGSQ